MTKPRSEWEPVLNLAFNVARKTCESGFDPHVILKVFQYFRENEAARKLYLSTTGCETGFERGNARKAILNPVIAAQIAKQLNAKVERQQPVQNEFIESYSVLNR
jgi:hypothetical protein